MKKSPSNFSVHLNSPFYASDSRNSQNPKNRPPLHGKLQTAKNLQIAQDFDKIIAPNSENINRKGQVLSKVERKDTRETDPDPLDFISRIPQESQIQKCDPAQQMIKKSQADPFLRRKLKVVVDNELKCLKKMNDQKNNVSKQLSKTMLPTQSAKILSQSSTNPINEQISRLPKDISKIINSIFLQFSPPSIKKIESQANILAVKEQSRQLQKKKHVQISIKEQNLNGSFTTLRHQLYRKKINCLQVLRVVKQKSLEKGKNE